MAEPGRFVIRPVDPATRGPAKALLRRVFRDEDLIDQLNIALLGTSLQFVSRLYGVSDQRVWVAASADETVLGVTGLYASADDDAAIWLGWFCVAPEARGQGVGGALLDFSIAEARQTGRAFLRLSTSTDPSEHAAQALYESRGLRITQQCQPLSWIGSGVVELIRELRLR